MATDADDPFGLVAVAATFTVPAVPGELLGPAHAASVEHALYRAAQGMTVETVTTDHAGRETVTTKQLPPNVTAAQALLAAIVPDRYGTGGVGQAGQLGQAGITLHITCNGLPLSQFVAKPVIEGEIVPTLPGPA
jgi:hypothetical protein